MTVTEAILTRRSIRKFTDQKPQSADLEKLVSLGRLYASAANLQPIRFALITKKENCDRLFTHLSWAKYLSDFTISESERPTAYILFFDASENSAFFEIDAGGCAANIMLGAQEMGLASCLLKIPSPQNVAEEFGFHNNLPRYAVALGYPAIESKIADYQDSPAYSCDENSNFTVPKRSVEEVVIFTDEK